MPNIPQPGLLLIAIAIIFLSLTLRDFLVAEGKLTPARKTWLRVALIFAVLSVVMYVLQLIST